MGVAMSSLAQRYQQLGFLAVEPIISAIDAARHRQRLEAAEAQLGPLHYLSKVHTILRSPLELATHPRALDIAESLLGPDVMLFDATYIVKEPQSEAHVSWHQDLTYWGFDGDEQVTMWLALSPATAESGCMRMVPGSHHNGQFQHEDIDDETNVLHRGQTVRSVSEDAAQMCPLQPGEASFHHGWTLHASMPNRSKDRRIGLNVQYITPRMRQLVNPNETAILVRGKDHYGHYQPDLPASADLDPAAIAAHAEKDRARKAVWDQAGR